MAWRWSGTKAWHKEASTYTMFQYYCVLNHSKSFSQEQRKANDKTILLTHWGRVTHICVSNLAIIGSDNGLSPGRYQAIIWTNAGILSIGPLGTNFSDILI